MDKLKMHSKDKTQENFEILQRLFPNAVTETITGYDEDGKAIVERAIDKDVLQQEINAAVVEGKDERYQFTWPDKKRAIISANAPINKTLRPCREESVDFDNTENLYIEGDNLEVLKLLQETYLGKIKMIYIDPPYNTGHDFVYNDKFSVSTDEWSNMSGELDEYGNRLTQNTESNGRFHTDWLNMIYPRLKIARDLLTDDGVIFISIDEHESHNLRKICDEVFGVQNFISQITWEKRYTRSNNAKRFTTLTESILCYVKNSFSVVTIKEKRNDKANSIYSNPDNDPRGVWTSVSYVNPASKSERPNLVYPLFNPITKQEVNHPTNAWKYEKATYEQHVQTNRLYWGKHGENTFPRLKRFLSEMDGGMVPVDLWRQEDTGTTDQASKELEELIGRKIFDFPKPKELIMRILSLLINEEEGNENIVLDFFSGSATTAHAVILLNANDINESKKGNRKFIMVQLPEKTDEKSEAYKAGYQNISEIGKERIRRAGSCIKEELRLAAPIEKAQNGKGSAAVLIDEAAEKYGEEVANRLDIGFRVLKLDSSNMKDVYYNPADFSKNLLDTTIDNIKEDRTPEDLLFQVMLDLGVLLSSKIDESEIAGKKVFNVADGFLIACFDNDVNEEVITAVAKQQPIYFVMRDSSLSTDTTATNFDQIFETYSATTVRRVI